MMTVTGEGTQVLHLATLSRKRPCSRDGRVVTEALRHENYPMLNAKTSKPLALGFGQGHPMLKSQDRVYGRQCSRNRLYETLCNGRRICTIEQ